MVRFYQRLAAGQPPAEALAAAKLDMVAAGAGPLATLGPWAAFILIGAADAPQPAVDHGAAS